MITNRLFVGIVSLMAFGVACFYHGVITLDRQDHHIEYRLGFTDGYREAFPASIDTPESRKPCPRRRNYSCGFMDGYGLGDIHRKAQEDQIQ